MTTEVSTVEARQGQTVNRMRYVLVISLVLAVTALAIVAGVVIG
jgi:hypothetical protein